MQYIQKKVRQDVNDNFLFNLLVDRGIINNSEEEFKQFLYPSKENLLDPYLLDNIGEGADLLIKHLNNDSKILIIQDCDQDGITSASALWNYIKKYKPDTSLSYKLHEGKQHGLEDQMEDLQDSKQFDLIILPDSSSNDYEYHKILKEAGYDILVLDHHEAPHYSEDAIVINNQLSQNYPNKQLTGASVVYKFLCVLDEKLGIDNADYYLDLAAVGSIGDMAQVTTLENRFINAWGLSHINNPALRELIEKQSFSIDNTSNLTPNDISFYITPIVNALIRVGSMREKEILFEAFVDGDKMVQSTKRGAKAGQFECLAEQSARNCVNARARQNREKEKGIEALEIQIFNNNLDENKILVVDASDLHTSTTLTGLMAMNIAATHKKPTLLGRQCSDGYFRGSMRGLNDSELQDFKAFLDSSNYMEYVEGHKNAAGFGIKTSQINKLIQYANKELESIDFNSGFYEVDYIVNGNSAKLKKMILELGEASNLWGQGNPEGLILIENVPIEKYDVIGKNADTLKFTFNNTTYIQFKATDTIEKIQQMNGAFNATVVGKPNINNWNGVSTPQILIENMEFKEISNLDF
jgi:single-stranded-DNA-specific exonuclease